MVRQTYRNKQSTMKEETYFAIFLNEILIDNDIHPIYY